METIQQKIGLFFNEEIVMLSYNLVTFEKIGFVMFLN